MEPGSVDVGRDTTQSGGGTWIRSLPDACTAPEVDLNWDSFRKHVFYTLFETKKECKNDSIKGLWPASTASISGGGAGEAQAFFSDSAAMSKIA